MSRWLFCLRQTGDDLVGGIVGVGDEVEGLFDGGAMPRSASILSSRVRLIAIGPHTSPSWMRTASGTAKKLEAALNEQAHRPRSECPMMEFGLGICFGLLMQELDRRHLAAALRGS